MKASDLPTPGNLRISQKLRILAAQAISAAEQRAIYGGTSPELAEFFAACSAAIPGAVTPPVEDDEGA